MSDCLWRALRRARSCGQFARARSAAPDDERLGAATKLKQTPVDVPWIQVVRS
jgi:hypothetical protein